MATEGQKIAVIADIHGNIAALDAVLQDIDAQGITDIYNLGDSVYGALYPRETAQRLMDRTILSVRGNQDRELQAGLLRNADESDGLQKRTEPITPPNATFDYVIKQLSVEQMKWLLDLPLTRTTQDLYMCHAQPTIDDVPLLETIQSDGVHWRSDEELIQLLEGIKQPIVLCAHTHVPNLKYLPDGRMIINPGSVGLPAYHDDLPYEHVMESRVPHAQYAVLDYTDGSWNVTHRSIVYDWEHAATQAAMLGRHDWAYALRTGLALRDQ
ncbi:metallophosphoesterase family protein [Paenibacillus kandeliae]|uniref:metallophosphoesterase family protein n=1 Tax=Paenibacillus kandeliae TaxID=3231269 RepID=UPI0034579C8B